MSSNTNKDNRPRTRATPSSDPHWNLSNIWRADGKRILSGPDKEQYNNEEQKG